MTDTFTAAKRSAIMRQVHSVNTSPERIVRSALHSLGVRFRLNTGQTLPGHPDVVLPSRRVVVFIHGCFWHQHSCARGARKPSTNTAYWNKKLENNVRRDRRVASELRKLGWHVIVIWECQTHDLDELRRRLRTVLLRIQKVNHRLESED